MTEPERAHLRELLDVAARGRIAAFVASGELHLCSRCGIPMDCCTPGCVTCWHRHRNRRPERQLASQVRWRQRSRVKA